MFTSTLSKQTKRNWWLDALLFSSGIVAILSGIYFLYLPTGGYQGGRNANYGLQILFSRETWDDLHTWGGIAMVAAAALHLVLHWSWVVSMLRKVFKKRSIEGGKMNARSRWNLFLNLVVGISFLLTALSGMYFLFFPGGHGASTALILFTRTTWDMIHTWAGVTFIATIVIHFAIHWRWVVKVASRLFERSSTRREVPETVPASNS